MPLRNTIQQAKKSGAASIHKGLSIQANGSFKNIDLEVVPLKSPLKTDQYFIVLFREALPGQKDASSTKSKKSGESRNTSSPEFRRFKEELSFSKKELSETKDYLQSVIEQQEAANEELKSANEEILSSNEELQSANEEIETSKEELQSTNEELNTVNDDCLRLMAAAEPSHFRAV